MKKIVGILTGLAMLLMSVMLTGCGGDSGGQKATGNVTLKAGFGSSIDNSSGGQGLKKFKELVEKESGGRITVELFGDGQLGNDKSMMEALQMGTLDVTLPSSSPVSEFSKSFLAFDLPFLFTEPEQADKVLDGANGQEILKSLESVNIVGLCYFENGFRNITNSKHPVKKVEDLAGLKLRTMQNPIHLETFKIWGANPQPMAFNEVFTALEQKTLDGQENPNTIIYDAGFYETQKYMTISHHFYTPYVLMISKKSWDKLSPEDQKLIQQCANEAKTYQRETNRRLDTEYLGKIKEHGVTVDTLSPEEIAKMKEEAKPIYDKFSGDIGKERLDSIMKEAE